MTRAELTKIDLQELKRLAGPGRIGEAIHVETRSLKALVDVVEAAEAYRTAKTADECDVTAERLEAVLSVFTESTNEEA